MISLLQRSSCRTCECSFTLTLIHTLVVEAPGRQAGTQPGVEPSTVRLVDDPLYVLSRSRAVTDHGKAATQVNTVKSRIKVFIQHCLLHAAQTHLSRAVLCFHVLENIFVVYEGQTQRKRCISTLFVPAVQKKLTEISLFWWRCRISTTKPERCMLMSRPPPV